MRNSPVPKAAEHLYDHKEFKSCKGKRFFSSKKAAKAFAKTLRGTWAKQIPYECRYCDMWHLTKKRKVKRK